MIDPLALLEATDHRGQNTTPEIAAILDITENETVRALRQAERDGLVHEETTRAETLPLTSTVRFGFSPMQAVKSETG
jgi:hypothetical protein